MSKTWVVGYCWDGGVVMLNSSGVHRFVFSNFLSLLVSFYFCHLPKIGLSFCMSFHMVVDLFNAPLVIVFFVVGYFLLFCFIFCY